MIINNFFFSSLPVTVTARQLTTRLFSVVRDRLQDGAERLETDGHVEQVRCVEEVVEVAEDREHEVPRDVQERLHNDTGNNRRTVIARTICCIITFTHYTYMRT